MGFFVVKTVCELLLPFISWQAFKMIKVRIKLTMFFMIEFFWFLVKTFIEVRLLSLFSFFYQINFCKKNKFPFFKWFQIFPHLQKRSVVK